MAQDYSTTPGATSAVFAHEMGHNLGFRHDEDITPCICDDPNPSGKCIMSTSARLVCSPTTLCSISFSLLTADWRRFSVNAAVESSVGWFVGHKHY